MSNILTATVSIKGVRPLWWHHFGEDALPLTPVEKGGVAGNDPSEWRRTAMATKEGQLYLDPTYVFATVREGGKYIKKNRASLMAPISATLQVTDDRVLIDRYFPGFPNGHQFDISKAEVPSRDLDEPVYLDVRGVRNPTTKARNVRYRIAAAPGWTTSFSLVWDKTIISRGELESVLINAGRLVGIGNGRSIGMGRFEIESFKIVE